MRHLYLILSVFLLISAIPLVDSITSTPTEVDAVVDETPVVVTQETLSPTIYRENGKLVLHGLRDTVIETSGILNPGLGVDLITYGTLNQSQVVDGVSFSEPVEIDQAHNITIKNSVFSNIDADVVLNIVDSSNVTIFNNDFTGINATSGNDLEVVNVVNSPGLVFQQNYFTNLDVATSQTITVLSLTGASENTSISSNSINNFAIADGDFNFNGYDLSSSDNITFYSNSMYNINAVDVKFLSISGLTQVNYYSNYFHSSEFASGVAFSFANVIDIQSNGYSSTYGNTIGEGSGFTGILYDTVQDVAQNFTYAATSTIEGGDYIGVRIINSNNISMSTVRVESITTSGNRVVGLDVEDSDDINIHKMDMKVITSTAAGIDLDNTQSIYGAYLNDSLNVVLNTSDYNNFDSNSQVFGIYAVESQVISFANDFTNYEGSVIHGSVVVRGVAGSQYNSSYFASWEASQIYGIEVYDTVASIIIHGEFFTNIEFTSFGHGIRLQNSEDIYLNQLGFFDIDSWAPFFDTSLVYLKDADNLTLSNTVFYNIHSYFTQMSSINTVNVTNSLFLQNSLINNYAHETAYIGMYFQHSVNLNVSFSFFLTVKSFATDTLSINAVDDNIGYGIVLEGTNSSTIQNNTATNVAQWYLSDAASVGVVLSGNTIGGVEDHITTFNKPSDLIYDADEDAGATLTWTASTELPEQASNYTITLNGDLVQEGNWTSGQAISYDISGLQFGTYTLIVELVQTNGFVTTDVVIITATELTDPAIISGPTSFTTVENGDTDLIWEVYELNPTSYSVYRGDIEIDYGFYEINDTITYSLFNTPLGTHNFTLTLRDLAGNEVSNELTVIVVPASPILVQLEDDEVTFEFATSNNTIDFTINGTIEGNIVVSVNEENIDTISWQSGVAISYNITGLLVGQYTYTFFVIDSVGNTANFDVLVNIIPQQINDADEESGGIEAVFDQFSEFLQDVQDVELTQENLIPLAAATFAGGLIFFPGLKYIRKQARAAESGVKKIGRRGKTEDATGAATEGSSKKTTNKKTTSKKTTSKKTTAKKPTKKKTSRR